MTSEHDECRVTVDGVAPAVVRLLRDAAGIAADHGRNWVGIEDVYAALASGDSAPLWWPREGREPITRGRPGGILSTELEGETVKLSYAQFRDLLTEWVPGPTPNIGPAAPATVTYELSGPHEAEFRQMLDRT
ncbi:hypothetical protein [Nocardia sp. NPDC020380]|uniref:hypothetical protein n=1 Tax=Nocardia sp. NPDC020380 TaxID=3364309 RepID=UPI00379FC0FE